MVQRTADVIRKIDALPPAEQEVLASYLDKHFEDVLDDARWEQLFQHSPGTLDALVAEVDDAIASGDLRELDPDHL